MGDLRQAAQRNRDALPAGDVEQAHGGEVALVLGQQLHHHPVLVVGRVDGADLPGPVGVVERVLDLVHVDAQRRGPVPGDRHLDLGVLDLKVAGDVGESRNVMQTLLQCGGALVQCLDVGALQGELVVALEDPASDVDHRRVLNEDSHAGNSGELPAEGPRYFVGAHLPLGLGLQVHDEPPLIHRSRPPPPPRT